MAHTTITLDHPCGWDRFDLVQEWDGTYWCYRTYQREASSWPFDEEFYLPQAAHFWRHVRAQALETAQAWESEGFPAMAKAYRDYAQSLQRELID